METRNERMLIDCVVTPREVAVALPFCRDQDGAVHICLVTSRKHDGKYVLPKGGVEKSDADSRSAAIREMWEEGELLCSRTQVEATHGE